MRKKSDRKKKNYNNTQLIIGHFSEKQPGGEKVKWDRKSILI